jgi:hypothetical protein
MAPAPSPLGQGQTRSYVGKHPMPDDASRSSVASTLRANSRVLTLMPETRTAKRGTR